MKTDLEVIDWGLLPYAEARARQVLAVQRRRLDEIPDTIFLTEHPAVITLGRGTKPDSVLNPHALPVESIERGGDATLHAPGQLVAYWVRKLEEGSRDLHLHLRTLEDFVIGTLARHGLDGEREPGKTGVWREGRKLASIGVACRHWITFHGLALNVDVDLQLFRAIRPCGFDPEVMSSIALEGGQDPSMEAVRANFRAVVQAWAARAET